MRKHGHILALCLLLCGAAAAQPIGKPGTVEEVELIPSDVHSQNWKIRYSNGKVAELTNLREGPDYWELLGSSKKRQREVRVFGRKTAQYIEQEREQIFKEKSGLRKLVETFKKYQLDGEPARARELTAEEAKHLEISHAYEVMQARMGEVTEAVNKAFPSTPSEIDVSPNYSVWAWTFEQYTAQPPSVLARLVHTQESSFLMVVMSPPQRLYGLRLTAIDETGTKLQVMSHPEGEIQNWKLQLQNGPEDVQYDRALVQLLSDRTIAVHVFDFEMGFGAYVVLTSYASALSERDHQNGIYGPLSASYLLPASIKDAKDFDARIGVEIKNWGTDNPHLTLVDKLTEKPLIFPINLFGNTNIGLPKETELPPRVQHRLNRTHLASGSENVSQFLDAMKPGEDTVIPETFLKWLRGRMDKAHGEQTDSKVSAFMATFPSILQELAPEVGDRVVHDLTRTVLGEVPEEDRATTHHLHLQLSTHAPTGDFAEWTILQAVVAARHRGVEHLVVTLDIRGHTPRNNHLYSPSGMAKFLSGLEKSLERNVEMARKFTLVVFAGPIFEDILLTTADEQRSRNHLLTRAFALPFPSTAHSAPVVSMLNRVTKLDLAYRFAQKTNPAVTAEHVRTLIREVELQTGGEVQPLDDLVSLSNHLRWAVEATFTTPLKNPADLQRTFFSNYLRAALNRVQHQALHDSTLNAFRSVTRLLSRNSPTHIPGALVQRDDILVEFENILRVYGQERAKSNDPKGVMFIGPPGVGKSLMMKLWIRTQPAERTIARVVNCSTPQEDPLDEFRDHKRPAYLDTFARSNALREEIQRKIGELQESSAEMKILFVDEVNVDIDLLLDFLPALGDSDKEGRRPLDATGIFVVFAMNSNASDDTRRLDTMQATHEEFLPLSRSVFVNSALTAAAKGRTIEEKTLEAFASRLAGIFYFRNRKGTSGSAQKDEIAQALQALEKEYGVDRIILPEDTVSAIRDRLQSRGGNFRGLDRLVRELFLLALDLYLPLHPEGVKGKLLMLRPPKDATSSQFVFEDVLGTQAGFRQHVSDVYQRLVTDITIAITNAIASAEQRLESLAGMGPSQSAAEAQILVARIKAFIEPFSASTRRPLFDSQGESTQTTVVGPYAPMLGSRYLPTLQELNESNRALVSELVGYLGNRSHSVFQKAFNRKHSDEAPNSNQGWETLETASQDELRALAGDFIEGFSQITALLAPASLEARASLKFVHEAGLGFNQSHDTKNVFREQKEWAEGWWKRLTDLRNRQRRSEVSDKDFANQQTQLVRDLSRAHVRLLVSQEGMGEDAYEDLTSFVDQFDGVPDPSGKYFGELFIAELEERIKSGQDRTKDRSHHFSTHPEMVAAGLALDDLLRQAAHAEVERQTEQKQDWNRGVESVAQFDEIVVAELLARIRNTLAAQTQSFSDAALGQAVLAYEKELLRYNQTAGKTNLARFFWEQNGNGSEAFLDALKSVPAAGTKDEAMSKEVFDRVLTIARADQPTLDAARASFAANRKPERNLSLDCVGHLLAMTQGARERLPKVVGQSPSSTTNSGTSSPQTGESSDSTSLPPSLPTHRNKKPFTK